MATPSGSGSAASRRVEVLHFNDVYHCDDFQGKSERALRMLLAMQPHVEATQPLVTFSGDLLAPSLMSSVTKGVHMMEVLEVLGVHVATPGNHDLDFGVDHFRRVTREPVLFAHEGPPRQAASQWISSNLTGLDGEALGGTQRCWLRNWNGVNVGVLAVSEDWLGDAGLSSASPVMDKFAKWEDEVTCARHWAQHLRVQGAELVLCLCHDTIERTRALASSVPEVDHFLGGHEHIYDEGENWVIAGFDFDDFCLLSFELKGDKVHCSQRRHVQVPADAPSAAELRAATLDVGQGQGQGVRLRRLVQHHLKVVEESLAQPLGCSLSESLDTRKFLMRTRETAAGNLFADAVLEALRPQGAECSILISGQISAGPGRTPAGPLTMGNVVEWFPWEGGTCILEVDGATLLQVLEHGCHKLPNRYGVFPQVSDVAFSVFVDPAAQPGERGSPFCRVSDVQVAGAPLDPRRAYRVATGEYVASGGDDYTMLLQAKHLLPPESAQAPLLHDAVVRHLRKLGPEVHPPRPSVVPTACRIRHLASFTMFVAEAEVGATPMDPQPEEILVRAQA